MCLITVFSIYTNKQKNYANNNALYGKNYSAKKELQVIPRVYSRVIILLWRMMIIFYPLDFQLTGL
jgi:hypothetical protein